MQQNYYLMLSHRASFTLKGNNIKMPNRYKIRSVKHSKNTLKQQQQLMPTTINHNRQSPMLRVGRLDKEELRINSQFHSEQALIQIQTELISKLSVKPLQQPSSIFLEPPRTIHFKPICKDIMVKQKRCTCGDCQECIKDFTYFLHLFSDDQSVPQITAKSWCIWRRKTNNRFMYFYGKRIHKVREIASLSKMITAMTMLDYLNTYSLEPKKVKFIVRKSSMMIGGTTANLQLGEIINLHDMLYGMMLPSGNDAAIVIAECIGLMVHLNTKKKQFNPYVQDWYVPYINKNYSYLFIALMNEKCQKVGTLDTVMYNSHGNDAYDQLKNISTCNEVAKISSEFMNYPLLKDIVNTKMYGKWENTNKLLLDGFQGIKTGITDSAGACLSAIYKDVIIIVLNSKSMNQRWIQVKKLVKWFMHKTNSS